MNDLPELTDKQYAFVHGVLEGKTLKDAYIEAYDTESMSEPAIRVEASRLRSHPNVALFIDHIRQAGAATATATLESHVAELERLKALALNNGNYGAAVKAEELRGKASGLYVDKGDSGVERPVLANVLSRIEMTNPALAALFRQSLGIQDVDSDGQDGVVEQRSPMSKLLSH